MTTLPNTLLPDCLSVLGGRCQLRCENIILMEGQGNYTLFRCKDTKKVLTSKSLSWYQKYLPPYFFRVHKSCFVNLTFVVAFEGEIVSLSDGQRITVSRRRRRDLRKLVEVRLTNPLS